MSILALKGTDAEDKGQAYAAYLNALMKGLETVEKYPALNEHTHRSDITDVKSEVVGFTGFMEMSSRKSSNFYANAREKLEGEIGGPGTALKFDFSKQGSNFTATDGQNLHTHLKSIFPNLKLNVRFTAGKPRCVVHVGL